MQGNKNNLVVFFLLLVIFLIGLALVFPKSFSLCDGVFECRDKYGEYENMGAMLALFAPVMFLVFLVVNSYYKARGVFNSWLRFSKYYLPIAAVLIFLMPAVDSSIFGFDKEFMTWLLAGIFFLSSLGIIIFKRPSLGSSASK
ncbi:MAG: Uncharacterized protein G01um101470_776 [Parcubacteria group bacterium Gr01-1014_70]|nr:MAG: Uncharacterized protein G01um101470_776 [Parcubacteria group bacterium Gr01-1014_70]